MEIPQQAEWLGSFKGAELSYLECEALALKWEAAQCLAQWKATDTIWFDYVRLHPVKAFYFFVDSYSRQYGRYLEENIDMGMKYARGLKGEVMEHRELRSLLSLKLEADKRGMPYRTFLAYAFDYFRLQGWTRPPRPSHIVNSAECLEFVEQQWAELATDMTVYAADTWFQAPEWVGHHHQQRYEKWIVQAIKQRERKEVALASALYSMQALRFEAALDHFPDLVHEAIAWADKFSNG